MATFTPRTIKSSSKASEYFLKLRTELDMDKYNLQKYKELFIMASFQAMHDAELAYDEVYRKCAENTFSKDNLLNCLEQEEKLSIKHPNSFDNFTYRSHFLRAIAEVKQQVNSGSLDYLFL